MKIGFDVSQAGKGAAGCGFFVKSLCTGLGESDELHEVTLFRDFGDFWFDEEKNFSLPFSGPPFRMGPLFQAREDCANYWNSADLDVKLRQLDLVHSNNFWCPGRAIGPKLVYTLYDLGFMDHPEWTTEENRIGCFEGVYRSSLYADFIIAISEFSRKRYLKYFPHVREERVGVVYPTSRFDPVTAVGRKPSSIENVQGKDFWLCVSTIEPRKNQLMLLEAYQSYLNESNEKVPLVFAGGSGWLMDDFQDRIKEKGLQNKVTLTGYVTDEELIWLYQNCFGNLYPALYEGFGLPVLEGMQLGAPTICSNTTSLPEVAGNGAILLDPCDAGGWAEKMILLEENEQFKSNLIERGLKQASKFTLKLSAKACLNVYQEALSMPKKLERHNYRY